MGRSLPSGECSSLIVLTGSLGDVARGLPLAGVLKAARPDGRVTWLVERRWAPLVSLCRHVDRVVEFDRAAGARALAPLGRALRQDRYHIAFDLQRLFKSGLFARWSGAPRRVGFHPRDSRELNRFFNTEYIAPHGTSVSKLRHYLAFAEHVGLGMPAVPDFGLDAARLGRHRRTVPAHPRGPYVVLASGTSWPSKDWPAHEAARLCRLIVAATSLDVVLVGFGPSARERDGDGDHDALSRAVRDGGGRIVDLRGRTSLAELASMLQTAELALGPDTGTGHVAAAVGTPYLGLFGPTDPRRVAPWGSEPLAVRSPDRCRCSRRRRCRSADDWCMASVTADLVWARMKDALGGTPVEDALGGGGQECPA